MGNIRILINDEEVLCSKNIQIKKNLLSTSSVILKNCYPASWEQDRDYTSRFYLPKDYSGVKIYNNNNLIFAGVLKNTGKLSLNPNEPKFRRF